MEYNVNNLTTIFVFIYMLISPLLVRYGIEIDQTLFVSAMVAIVGLLLAIWSSRNPNTIPALGNGPQSTCECDGTEPLNPEYEKQ